MMNRYHIPRPKTPLFPLNTGNRGRDCLYA